MQLVSARTARGHGAPARRSDKPNQPDDIADQHQQAARRQRRIIDPHREPQIRGAVLVDQPRDFDDLAAVPDQRAAEHDGGDAVEHLHPSRHAGRDDVEHEIGPHMAVGADQLAGHDHDRPDQQIDDDLLGIADRLLRKEVARHDLPESKGERRQAEHADERLLDAIPDLHHQAAFRVFSRRRRVRPKRRRPSRARSSTASRRVPGSPSCSAASLRAPPATARRS